MSTLNLNSINGPSVTGQRSSYVAEEKRPVVQEKQPQTVAAETQSAAPKKSKAETSLQDLRKMTEDLQRKLSGVNAQIQFSVDEASGQNVVKMLDKDTKEVIRQIPTEEMLQIARHLESYTEGLLVKDQA